MSQLSDQERGSLLAIVDRLAFFRDFTDYEKKRITAFHTNVQKFKMGQYVIREGATDTSFFILLSGTMSVVKKGQSSALAELHSGDFFGEVSFLTNRPRTSNIVANEVCYALRVDQELMGKLGAEIREKIKDRIIQRLVARLDDMNTLLSQVTHVGRF